MVIAFFVAVTAVDGFIFYVMNKASGIREDVQAIEITHENLSFDLKYLCQDFDDLSADFGKFSNGINTIVGLNTDAIKAIGNAIMDNTATLNNLVVEFEEISNTNS